MLSRFYNLFFAVVGGFLVLTYGDHANWITLSRTDKFAVVALGALSVYWLYSALKPKRPKKAPDQPPRRLTLKPMDNARRAQYGLLAIVVGTPDSQTNSEQETNLVDTLTNIMHWCEMHDVDFDETAFSARGHFLAEMFEDEMAQD